MLADRTGLLTARCKSEEATFLQPRESAVDSLGPELRPSRPTSPDSVAEDDAAGRESQEGVLQCLACLRRTVAAGKAAAKSSHRLQREVHRNISQVLSSDTLEDFGG